MAQNKTVAAASEMLSGLKSRLGFAHNDDEEDFSAYDADFNDYDDFDDDYDDYGEYDSGYGAYESDYGNGASGYRPATAGSSSRFGRADSTPNLVSIDDVREHSRTVINSSRGSFEHRNIDSTPRRSTAPGRNLVETSGPAPSSPAYTAAQREGASRSEGLNSLFESTGTSASSASSRLSSGLGASPAAGQRELKVIKPISYNDVEGVARAVKAGNAVVLAMGNTPDSLYSRILDFSFGVASALDARVDNPAAKVYVIATGGALTADEQRRLQSQGVL